MYFFLNEFIEIDDTDENTKSFIQISNLPEMFFMTFSSHPFVKSFTVNFEPLMLQKVEKKKKRVFFHPLSQPKNIRKMN